MAELTTKQKVQLVMDKARALRARPRRDAYLLGDFCEELRKHTPADVDPRQAERDRHTLSWMLRDFLEAQGDDYDDAYRELQDKVYKMIQRGATLSVPPEMDALAEAVWKGRPKSPGVALELLGEALGIAPKTQVVEKVVVAGIPNEDHDSIRQLFEEAVQMMLGTSIERRKDKRGAPAEYRSSYVNFAWKLIRVFVKNLRRAAEIKSQRLLDDYSAGLEGRIASLEQEVTHWKANHDNRVEAARILIDRPDLPFERVEAYKLHVELQEQLKVLKEARASLDKPTCWTSPSKESMEIGSLFKCGTEERLVDEVARLRNVVQAAFNCKGDVSRIYASWNYHFPDNQMQDPTIKGEDHERQ